jgi:hypothetical protein
MRQRTDILPVLAADVPAVGRFMAAAACPVRVRRWEWSMFDNLFLFLGAPATAGFLSIVLATVVAACTLSSGAHRPRT